MIPVRRRKKCFWRIKLGWSEACLACHDLKKSCVAGGVELSEVEAGLSKKRMVEDKGKGNVKVKVRPLVSGVVESIAVVVLQDILQELKDLCGKVQDICAFSQCSITVLESSWSMLKQTESHVTDLVDHFVPLEVDGEGSRDRAENEEGHGVEMEQIEVDMENTAMDETLQ